MNGKNNIFSRMQNNTFLRILKSISISAVAIFTVLTLQSIKEFNPIYLGIGLVGSFGGIFALTRHFAQDKDIFKSLDILFVTVNFCAYLILRSLVTYAPISNYLCELLNIENFGLFMTLFGLGYGFAQFGVGYLLSKYSGKLLAITGALVSLCIFGVSSITTPTNASLIAPIVHGLMGILCSAYAVSIGSFIREIRSSPKNFNILINVILLSAVAISSVFSSYFGSQPIITHEIFAQLSNIVGTICLSGSIYFGIRYFIINRKPVIVIAESNNEEIATEDVSYTDVLKIISSNKQYVNLAIQAILIMLAGSLFRNTSRFTNELCAAYGNDTLAIEQTCKNFIELGFITGTSMLISLAEFFNSKQMIIIYTVMNLISIIAIAFHFFISAIPSMALQIALCASFASHIGHNIPQIIAGSQESNKKVGNTMIGIFNSLSMLVGQTLLGVFALPQLDLSVCLIILIVVNSASVFMALISPKPPISQ